MDFFNFSGGGSQRTANVGRLHRIEKKLDLILHHLGLEFQPFSEECRQAADSGNKILAIKLYRKEAGLGLAAAKKDVEEYLGKFQRLSPTSAETKFLETFKGIWGQSKTIMNRTNELSGILSAKQLSFWKTVHAADDVIDFKLQTVLEEENRELDKLLHEIDGRNLFVILGVLGLILSLVPILRKLPATENQ